MKKISIAFIIFIIIDILIKNYINIYDVTLNIENIITGAFSFRLAEIVILYFVSNKFLEILIIKKFINMVLL